MLIRLGLAPEFRAAATPLELKLGECAVNHHHLGKRLPRLGGRFGAQRHQLIVVNPERISSNRRWNEERRAQTTPEELESSLAQEALTGRLARGWKRSAEAGVRV